MENVERMVLELPEEGWDDQAVRGYELNAFCICPRKCWFLQRQLMMEPHSPLVELGRLIHEEAMAKAHSATQKEPIFSEVSIEGFARIDRIAGELVYEIKRRPSKRRAPIMSQSNEAVDAHRLQLLYYLYLLHERGLDLKGVLYYPEQNRREMVQLDEASLRILQEVLHAIQQLRTQPLPPQMPKPMTICRTCAYQELCWCDEESEPTARSLKTRPTQKEKEGVR